VTAPPGAPTILIADEDVGFVWWLGELFTELGYHSLPALNCKEALSVVKQAGREVDLLLIDPRLEGSRRLIDTLTRVRQPKIVLIEPDEAALAGIPAVATMERPSGPGPVSRGEWRLKLQRLLIRAGIRAAS
jgi:CheY-like chemotaxis protein